MRTVGVLAAAILLAGCGAADGGASAAASFPPDDATMVSGTATCEITSTSSARVDGVSEIYEHFTCTLDMSDPRVSGTEELDVTTRVLDQDIATPWVVTAATLTTEAGTWTGEGAGVLDWSGSQPYAEGVEPFNYGEMRYSGAGDLAGLELSYYAAGSDYGLAYVGWIEETG